MPTAANDPGVVDGDVILLGAGTFVGVSGDDHNFTLGKTLTVRGMGPLTVITGEAPSVMVVRGNSDITLEDLVIDGESSMRALAAREGASLTARRVTLRNGVTDAGGCLRGWQGAGIVLEEVEAEDCSADVGGAINIADADLLASDLRVQGSTATGVGGGLYVGPNGTAVVDGARFEDNQADAGGGLYAVGETSIQNTEFLSNVGTTRGGGALLHGPFDVRNVIFDGNSATETAGAFGGNGSGEFNRVQFLRNQAGLVGGAGDILGGNWAFQNIFGCENSAAQAGFLASNADQLSLDNGLFVNNPATDAAASDNGSLIFNTPSTLRHLTIWASGAPRSLTMESGSIAASVIGEPSNDGNVALWSTDPNLLQVDEVIAWNQGSTSTTSNANPEMHLDLSSCADSFGGYANGGLDVSTTTFDPDGSPGDAGHLGGLLLDGDFWGVDADGDGVRVPLDCDDDDPNVYPGNADPCDGVDADCDGSPEESGEFYADLDEDGFGSGVPEFCGPSEGFVADGSDCDDADPLVNPLAEEVCNGVDDDCDFEIDAADDSIVDAEAFLEDLDGDGFGSELVMACAGDPNVCEVAGECDDTDPTINPDAQEICEDQVDNDCDSLIDAEDPDFIALAVSWADLDGDGFGDPTTELSSCDPIEPGRVEPGSPDCDDGNPTINPGQPEIPDDGVDNDCQAGDALELDSDGDGVPDGIDPEPFSAGNTEIDGPPEPQAGCGCAANGRAPLWLAGFAFGIVLRRRRSRNQPRSPLSM